MIRFIRTHKAAIMWAAVAVWLAVIYIFSSQTGTESSGVSDPISSGIADITGTTDPGMQELLSLAVRKAAHIAEYMILGILLCAACFLSLPGNIFLRAAAAFLAGTVCGALDELHQYFVPGRAAQFADIGIDALGVALGTVIWLIVLILKFNKSYVDKSRG